MGSLITLLPMLLIFGGMIFFMNRSQKKKQRKEQEQREERPYRSSQSHGTASRGNSKCVC